MNTMELSRVGHPHALSPLQQRLLPIALSTPLSGHITATLHGPITEKAAHKAASTLLGHHPLLRTTFIPGEPAQQFVHHAAPISIDWIGPEQEHEAPRFDLSRLPLTHISIRQEGEERFSLNWSIHPLLVDDTSAKLLLRDFLHLLTGGSPAPAPLACDPSPSKGEGTGFGTLSKPLSPELLGQLTHKASTTNMPLETLLCGAFAEAMGQLKDSRDVVFGVTLSGRTSPVMHVANCVGPLEELVPLRVELDNPDLLADLSDSMTSLNARGPVPDALLCKWADVSSSEHLFETSLALRAQPAEQSTGAFKLTNLEIAIPNGTPLQVDVDTQTGALSAIFDRSLFNEPQVTAFLAAFELAARSAGETLASTVSIAGPELETEPTDVLMRFLETATQNPKAIALSDAEATLSFGSLKSCAESVAAYLIEAGVVPGECVALSRWSWAFSAL